MFTFQLLVYTCLLSLLASMFYLGKDTNYEKSIVKKIQ